MGPRVALFACLVVVGFAGCGTAEREHDAAAVAESFHAALEQGDGQAACDELSEETASKLEQEEQRPCEVAILDLDLPKGGSVAYQRVEMRSAETRLSDGGADFLDEGPDGWKVSAAGCEPTAPDRPYECELEG